MSEDLATTIENEVMNWPGVTTGDTGRGGLQFTHGRVELGIFMARAARISRSPGRSVTSLSPRDGHRCIPRCPIRAGSAVTWAVLATPRP